jgi:hypothetical protein
MPPKRERRVQGEPEYVVGHVEAALAADPRVNELGVHVVVRGERLYLNGTVSTDERRVAVAEVAAEFAPGYEIHNETVVGVYAEADSATATETLS